MSTPLFILGIALFVLLIILHELGHFLAAKRNGVEVEEFGIGFPPRIGGKTMGKGIFRTYYTFNLLPLGGFVRLKGENDADKRKGSYGAAPFRVKAKIIMAGVAMNVLAAIVLLTVLSWVGLPRLVDNQYKISSDTTSTVERVVVGYVEPDSPADKAGLQVGDDLLEFANEPVVSSDRLFYQTAKYAGQTVPVVIERSNQQLTINTTLRDQNQDGYLGVSPTDIVMERSTWSAPIRGVVLTGQFAWLTLQGIGSAIGNLFTGQAAVASESVAGPIGIVVLLREITVAGPQFVLFFIAIISVTLAVMNALPIPALDGGRLFVSALFRWLKKPLTPKIEQMIHGGGMAVLLLLMLLISVVDVRRFF